MKTHHCLSMILVASLLAGCATQEKKTAPSSEKPVHDRGWIGGSYQSAKPRPTWANWLFGGHHLIYSYPPELDQKSAILVASLETNAPAYRAGLRSGDLLLELDHRPVAGLTAFRNTIHAARPGSSLAAKVWREGMPMNFEIAVGLERFQHQGTLAMGLPGFWKPLHPVPTRENPIFSLVALGWQKEDSPPLDFDSPEQRYRQSCSPESKIQAYDGDWNCWLAIFQVRKGKTILEQNPVVVAEGEDSRPAQAP